MGSDASASPDDLPPIPYARQKIEDADIEAVVAALRSDFLTQGPRVGYFEDALSEATGARYAVAVSSGTAALHLACLGLGIAKGDVGIVPAITFAATANCLRYVGANVAFADVDATSGKSGVSDFQDACERNERSRIALPVSFTGSAAGLAEIGEWAHSRGLFVIEDAAHSLGATYSDSGGKAYRSGSCAHSDAAILSFHPVKHICSGEGGAILTNDETLARRVRSLRSHGIEKLEDWRYNQTELGYNYRLTDLQAALATSQLSRLERNLERRRQLVAIYAAELSEGAFASRIRIASTDEGSAWHLFVVHFEDAATRMAAYRYLRERGILAQIHYLPVYHHDYYRSTQAEPLAGAERYYAGCLSLPLFPALSDAEQRRVIETLKAFLREA